MQFVSFQVFFPPFLYVDLTLILFGSHDFYFVFLPLCRMFRITLFYYFNMINKTTSGQNKFFAMWN